jgi:hypothetical protein
MDRFCSTCSLVVCANCHDDYSEADHVVKSLDKVSESARVWFRENILPTLGSYRKATQSFALDVKKSTDATVENANVTSGELTDTIERIGGLVVERIKRLKEALTETGTREFVAATAALAEADQVNEHTKLLTTALLEAHNPAVLHDANFVTHLPALVQAAEGLRLGVVAQHSRPAPSWRGSIKFVNTGESLLLGSLQAFGDLRMSPPPRPAQESLNDVVNRLVVGTF